MNIVVYYEAFFIGCICCLLFFCLNFFASNFVILLFLTGFIKHFGSYYFGLQTYYCKTKLNFNYIAISSNIIIESILEGFIFIYFGLLLTKIITNNYILIFILGFIIHIIADIYGVHELFLKLNCKIKNDFLNYKTYNYRVK